MNPKVSVITAVFNLVENGRVESFLKCVESVRAQTYDNIEHLVIDGGSRDGTVELLAEHADKGCFRYVSEPDRGVYDAMNKGARQATGEYLVFLNSDDWWHDSRGVEASVSALEESGADFSFAPSWHYSPDGKKIVRYMPPQIARFFLLMPFCHQTMFTRKSVFDELGGFREGKFRSAADFDFILRLCLSGHRHVGVELNFTAYRLGGLSDVCREVSLQECAQAMSEAFSRFDPEFYIDDGWTALCKRSVSERVYRGILDTISPELRRLVEALPRRSCGKDRYLFECGKYSYPVSRRRSYFLCGFPVLRLYQDPQSMSVVLLGGKIFHRRLKHG